MRLLTWRSGERGERLVLRAAAISGIGSLSALACRRNNPSISWTSFIPEEPKIPCDRKGPLRGKAYYEWIRANAYDRWVTWRCEKFTEFYAKMAKILTEARPDLRLWFIAAPSFDAVSELKDNPGYEPLEARFAQAFRALPPEKMADWPHTSDAPEFVRVRALEKGGTRWFYAVNTESKPAKVTFRTPVAVRDTVSGRTHKAGAVSLDLGPYELRSFVSSLSR